MSAAELDDDRADMMLRLEAGRAYIDATYPGYMQDRQRRQAEMDLFMSVFHPDHERIIVEAR